MPTNPFFPLSDLAQTHLYSDQSEGSRVDGEVNEAPLLFGNGLGGNEGNGDRDNSSVVNSYEDRCEEILGSNS